MDTPTLVSVPLEAGGAHGALRSAASCTSRGLGGAGWFFRDASQDVLGFLFFPNDPQLEICFSPAAVGGVFFTTPVLGSKSDKFDR